MSSMERGVTLTLTIANLIKKLDGEVTRLNPTVVPSEMPSHPGCCC